MHLKAGVREGERSIRREHLKGTLVERVRGGYIAVVGHPHRRLVPHLGGEVATHEGLVEAKLHARLKGGQRKALCGPRHTGGTHASVSAEAGGSQSCNGRHSPCVRVTGGLEWARVAFRMAG